jgi:pre-mRNA-splicing factor ATP-dependent RNA helicase DHX38/PRP16
MNTPKTFSQNSESGHSYNHNNKRNNYTDNNAPIPTPSHKYNKWADDRKRTGITPSALNKKNKTESANFSDEEEYNEDQKKLDREWYGMDENEGFDQENNSFAQINEEFLSQKQESIQQKWKRKVSFHQQQRNRDVEKWETNRMLQSGVVSMDRIDEDFEEESEARVHVTVHHMVPPFLDGRITFTKQFEPVVPLKDPTSDMAIVCRKGSVSVRRYREQKERKQAAEKVNKLAGTKLGNILGVKQKSDKEEINPNDKEDGDSVDYKKSQQFAEHMGDGSQAVSDFALKNTLKEQRQFLPVFAIKEELLKIIRENSVIIVVGETGSGKTTQLTQYLHEDGYTKRGPICCTQPRRVEAMSVAKRVS